MSVLLGLGALAALVPALLVSYARAWRREVGAVAQFAAGLDAGTARLREPTGWIPLRSLDELSLTGALEGHAVELGFATRSGRNADETWTRHADLAPDADDATACRTCRTVHHGECFAEAGCTVFGCSERRRSRS